MRDYLRFLMTRVRLRPRKKDGAAHRRSSWAVEKLSAVENLVDEINAGSNWNHAALMAHVE